MGSGGFLHRPFSSALSSCCFCAYQLFSLEEIHSSGVRSAPSGTDLRHLEASQLLSLQFWLVPKIVRAVLAFHQRVSVNSRVTNQLYVTVPVTLLLFRPCETPFAFLSSFFLRWLRHFIVSNCRVYRSTFIDEALLCLSVCRER